MIQFTNTRNSRIQGLLFSMAKQQKYLYFIKFCHPWFQCHIKLEIETSYVISVDFSHIIDHQCHLRFGNIIISRISDIIFSCISGIIILGLSPSSSQANIVSSCYTTIQKHNTYKYGITVRSHRFHVAIIPDSTKQTNINTYTALFTNEIFN